VANAERARSENRGAGVPPAVARASCPRAGAGRSRDRGRDARATRCWRRANPRAFSGI